MPQGSRRVDAEGARNPKDIIRKAGEAMATLRPEGPQNEVEIISKEAWHSAWVRTCKGNTRSWKIGGAGIRWLSGEQVEAIGITVRKWLQNRAEPPPVAWAKPAPCFS